MPAPQELDPAESPRALLGSEIRKYRMASDMSQEQLAEKINFSAGMVSFVERATRIPSRQFVELCEKALGLNGELLRLWPLVSMTARPEWFQPWLEIEPDATVIRTWQPNVVPGLLQTEAYARAILSGRPRMADDQIEEAVVARLDRQLILDRVTPPMLWAVLDEGVLSRPIGGRDVMREQLEHLIKMSDNRSVTIQVSPMDSRATIGLEGGFMIAGRPGQPDTVYMEAATLGFVTIEAEKVAKVINLYDALRAEAFPARASIELIKEKLVNLWT
ncbi:helix-turn-helix domain-containing protein [Acrocarpospora catenulata]|uniref:helix-turn-helix domain-containing protein n=1 Tax=Acrocarpospora catenulata TaxID=2836182 RepID=UPI001BDA006B|nr:helix-turn-helix transcriptional regulator [Acrocarpospora catenulata]